MTYHQAITAARALLADESASHQVRDVLAVLLEALRRRGMVNSKTDASTYSQPSRVPVGSDGWPKRRGRE